MFGASEFLLTYYVAFSYVIFLGWGAFAPSPGIGSDQAVRYLRWVPLAGVLGVAHPALAFAVRDIAGQVGVELPELPDSQPLAARHARLTRTVDACTAASLAVTAVTLVLTL